MLDNYFQFCIIFKQFDRSVCSVWAVLDGPSMLFYVLFLFAQASFSFFPFLVRGGGLSVVLEQTTLILQTIFPWCHPFFMHVHVAY